MRLALTNYVHLDCVLIGDDVLEITWDTRKPKTEKCSGCECDLSQFTGIHIVEDAKKTRTKVVCGMCVGQFELDGWRQVYDK